MSETKREIRLTVVVGAALIAQTAAALLWTGSAAARLTEVERRAAVGSDLVERTARLEEQSRAIRGSLDRIERKIDRLETEKMP